MKKKFLLFAFLLLGFTSYSQKKHKTLGILISPNTEFNNPNDYTFKERTFSYSYGCFYDHQLTHRFGINTGLLLDTERYRYDYSGVRTLDDMNLPERAKVRTNAIEVPFNLTFCFNPTNESGYRAFLYSGIMLHRQFFSKYTAYYSDEVVINKSDGYNNDFWADSYMNLGFEFRRTVGSHFLCVIGGGAKFRPAHSLDFSSEFRDPFILNLNLKFGRNL